MLERGTEMQLRERLEIGRLAVEPHGADVQQVVDLQTLAHRVA